MDDQPEGLSDNKETSKSQGEKIELQEQSVPHTVIKGFVAILNFILKLLLSCTG